LEYGCEEENDDIDDGDVDNENENNFINKSKIKYNKNFVYSKSVYL
jgi:hypothetical protein